MADEKSRATEQIGQRRLGGRLVGAGGAMGEQWLQHLREFVQTERFVLCISDRDFGAVLVIYESGQARDAGAGQRCALGVALQAEVHRCTSRVSAITYRTSSGISSAQIQ